MGGSRSRTAVPETLRDGRWSMARVGVVAVGGRDGRAAGGRSFELDVAAPDF